MDENEIAKTIVDSAFKVHTTLGPGLLESVYEVTLAYEISTRGLTVERQIPIPILYGPIRIEEGYRADILVNGLVLIEVKSVESLQPVHSKQLLTYLRLTNKKLGLLINFNENLIKNGIKRVVNGLPEKTSLNNLK